MSRAIRMLQDQRKITRAQMDQATLLQGRYGQTLSFHLINIGALDEKDFANFVERNFPGKRWPGSKLKSIPRHVISVIPAQLAANVRILPIALDGDRLLLGVTDSSRSYVLEEASYQTRCHVSPVIVTESEMTWALEHYHGIVTRNGAPHMSLMRTPGDDLASEPDRETLPSVVVHNPVALGRVEHTVVRRPPPSRHLTPMPKQPVFVGCPDGDADDDAPSLAPTIPDSTRVPKHQNTERYQQISRPSRAFDSSIPLAVPRGPSRRPQTLADNVRRSSRPPAPGAEPRGPRALASLVADMVLEQDVKSLPDRLEGPNPAAPSSPAEGDIVRIIERTRNRDGIIDLALDYLLHFSARAAFFVVKGDRIRGYAIKGALTHREAVRSFWIPTTARSTLCDAVLHGHIHLGPIGTTPADSIFAASLGGRPSQALVIPVNIGPRVACLLYCDGLNVDVPPEHRLEKLAKALGSSLAELIAKD